MNHLRFSIIISISLLAAACSSSRKTVDGPGKKKTAITGVRPKVKNPSTGVINATGDNLTPGINSVNRNGAGSEENAAAIANDAISRANADLKNPKVVPDAPSLEKQLAGKWKYISRSGGFAGKKETADPKAPEVLEFKLGYGFQRTLSGKVTAEGTYELIRVKSIYSGREENAIRFNDSSDRPQMAHILVIKGNSLILADNVYDGFTTSYSRL